IIPTFVLGSVSQTSPSAGKTAESGSTTAGSMRLWTDSLSHRYHVDIFCETRHERAKQGHDAPGLTRENPAAHRIGSRAPRARVPAARLANSAYPADQCGGPATASG